MRLVSDRGSDSSLLCVSLWGQSEWSRGRCSLCERHPCLFWRPFYQFTVDLLLIPSVSLSFSLAMYLMPLKTCWGIVQRNYLGNGWFQRGLVLWLLNIFQPQEFRQKVKKLYLVRMGFKYSSLFLSQCSWVSSIKCLLLLYSARDLILGVQPVSQSKLMNQQVHLS